MRKDNKRTVEISFPQPFIDKWNSLDETLVQEVEARGEMTETIIHELENYIRRNHDERCECFAGSNLYKRNWLAGDFEIEDIIVRGEIRYTDGDIPVPIIIRLNEQMEACISSIRHSNHEKTLIRAVSLLANYNHQAINKVFIKPEFKFEEEI